MILWRLSGRQHAEAFDGGYGLRFDGRWNTAGHAVTYCATSPSLCVLEKLVHVEDPVLLPDLVMVTYEAPDSLEVETIGVESLPFDSRLREGWTQRRGNEWHGTRVAPLLRVPSVIVPIAGCPDVNIVINHDHPAASEIRLRRMERFVLDPRLV